MKIGRSLIINMDCIYYINPQKQQLVLRDRNGYRTRPLNAPLIALKALKDAIDRALEAKLNENENTGDNGE